MCVISGVCPTVLFFVNFTSDLSNNYLAMCPSGFSGVGLNKKLRKSSSNTYLFRSWSIRYSEENYVYLLQTLGNNHHMDTCSHLPLIYSRTFNINSVNLLYFRFQGHSGIACSFVYIVWQLQKTEGHENQKPSKPSRIQNTCLGTVSVSHKNQIKLQQPPNTFRPRMDLIQIFGFWSG